MHTLYTKSLVSVNIISINADIVYLNRCIRMKSLQCHVQRNWSTHVVSDTELLFSNYTFPYIKLDINILFLRQFLFLNYSTQRSKNESRQINFDTLVITVHLHKHHQYHALTEQKCAWLWVDWVDLYEAFLNTQSVASVVAVELVSTLQQRLSTCTYQCHQ